MDPSSEIVPVADLPPPSLKRRMACWLYEGMLLFAVTSVKRDMRLITAMACKLLCF